MKADSFAKSEWTSWNYKLELQVSSSNYKLKFQVTSYNFKLQVELQVKITS